MDVRAVRAERSGHRVAAAEGRQERQGGPDQEFEIVQAARSRGKNPHRHGEF